MQDMRVRFDSREMFLCFMEGFRVGRDSCSVPIGGMEGPDPKGKFFQTFRYDPDLDESLRVGPAKS